ncbi:MAG: ABC transporter permease [SAR324 cluster bacterium]|nr:ABC transporter permease [SAR324 cluster bacterium]
MIRELTRQEFRKLSAQRYPYLLLALVLIAQIAHMLAAALAAPETTLDVLTGPQLWAKGAGTGLRFGVYGLLVVGAMGFSQEFAQGTVKTILVLPLRRWEWVAAKLVFLVLLALGLLLAVVMVGVLIVALTLGWGDVVREEVVLYGRGEVWLQVLAATALTAVFLLPVCAFAQLIGLYFSSSGAAVGSALLLGISLEAAGALGGFGKYIFMYHLHRPIGIVEKLGRGLPFRWDALLYWGLGACLLSFAIFCVWQVLRMERMDIAG